jgi:cytochrome b561
MPLPRQGAIKRSEFGMTSSSTSCGDTVRSPSTPTPALRAKGRFDLSRRRQGAALVDGLAVFGLLGVGLWMTGLPISLLKLQVYAWHKWIGLVVLILTVARLLWRWRHPPPPLPDAVTRWERALAPVGHWALLALLVAMPVSGWLMSSAAGVSVFWFGVLALPDLVPRNPDLFEALRTAHFVLSRCLIVVVALHIVRCCIMMCCAGASSTACGLPGKLMRWLILSVLLLAVPAPVSPAAAGPLIRDDRPARQLAHHRLQTGAFVSGRFPAWSGNIVLDRRRSPGRIDIGIQMPAMTAGNQDRLLMKEQTSSTSEISRSALRRHTIAVGRRRSRRAASSRSAMSRAMSCCLSPGHRRQSGQPGALRATARNRLIIKRPTTASGRTMVRTGGHNEVTIDLNVV